MITFKELKRNQKNDMSNLPTIKVSLLGDSATQFLATAIKGMGIERGYNIDLFEAEYNQVERQVLDPTSDLYQHKAQYTIVFQSTHKLMEKYAMMSADEQVRMADDRLDFIRIICAQVSGHIVYYNYPEIEDTVFGSYANKVQTSFTYQLRKLNYELMNLAQECQNLFICDLCGLQNKFGRDMMYDSTVYMSTEMLLSLDALPYVASRTMDIIGSIEGKFKKCLILDLDNTVWGGVVGDDGWENIQVGHGLGIGKVFTEFQEWVKKLKKRGIIVCVCSKNDENKAKEPFAKNPEMVLKLDDISVFIANWENKADNIRIIQSILNIGFDSMVFLDDNPFERNMVRKNVPGVTVPELPEDPGQYLEFLYSQNLFETASYSNADKDRTKQYQVEAKRVTAAKAFTNEADFLKSLNMLSEVKGFDKFNTLRVAQLSQRSNQFNLRTVRYTEDQITAIDQSDKYATFSFTLEDKFGDNGLIAVIIMEKKDAETLFIDTWFMSCRVLKRGMENFTLNILVDYAFQNGFKKIIGEYLPTAKNKMVKELYPSLGFDAIDGVETAQWVLNVEKYQNRECYIEKK
ncbi:HAD-IIIC family phosphatase [Bacteroides thetaiotaomicron]|jgi:fkbH domain|uniref:HAD-IIIC family phosphatase n=2 Tax=Bacteroides thetaiotaomicron TaxID=818 RepID=A0A7J5JFF1_BACT4|nr:HAD-IIIC family phosphatase [Bacteroides thetaiotaomicron]MBD9094519.1 HAD-IIIC family phosphatase [Bacteroides oleiciplenus]KAB4450114.1 HAD-IIIC family phosphatase [Bacteroides thetaiotaomicron]MCE9150485.1 HAD-IIIC family phosphatase [Bacteroides thetaiotaomicron]MCS2954978.1 HAD-IIIC family phosphatase [Bacteroides thetaiotaomicron]QUT38894.1 FkbH: FkbH domain protein [Bacteroides thetaiotaomicron]